MMISRIAAFLLTTTGLLAAADFTPDGSHLFILSGQSNMRQPLPATFENAVERLFGRDKVVVVVHAHPSQPIRRWYKQWRLPEGEVEDQAARKIENGDLYDALMKKVCAAVADRPLASVSYIWMQGEADAGNGWGGVYEHAFYGVLDQIKADLKVKRVNYVLGRINDHWVPAKGTVHGDLVRNVQQRIGEAHPHGAWVDTDDLNTGLNPWGIYEFNGGHFPPPAYKVLAERFARKACLLIDPARQLDEQLFGARFFDTSDDVANHGGTGGTVTGPTPQQGQLAALSDGRFATIDPEDAGWVTFTPDASGQMELTLDLGRETVIDQLGINLLFHPGAGAPFPSQMTFLTSVDGTTYSPLVKNIRFAYGKAKLEELSRTTDPQPLLVLSPGPVLRGKPAAIRYLRIVAKAPQLMVDEILINPQAEGQPAELRP